MTQKLKPSRTLIVPSLENPQRLDKFLVGQFRGTNRAFWRKNLEDCVRVDGKRAVKGQVLRGGEKLFLNPKPFVAVSASSPNPKMKLKVLYEDPFLLAIDKPGGIPSAPLRAVEKNTVVNGILAQFPGQAEVDPSSREAGLLNRLDNGTSGILLFARSREAKRRFASMNREGKFTKVYQAWVQGRVEKNGVVRTPIAHHPKNKKKMILPQGEKEAKKLKARPAWTTYEVLKLGKNFSLLRLTLSKGSRHQIRIHLASLGHPVVGDSLYGGPGLGNAFSKSPRERFLLHASQVYFRHPFLKKGILISAPLPPDFHSPKRPNSKLKGR